MMGRILGAGIPTAPRVREKRRVRRMSENDQRKPTTPPAIDMRSERTRKAEAIAKRAVHHLESLDALPGGNQSLQATMTIARCIEESDL